MKKTIYGIIAGILAVSSVAAAGCGSSTTSTASSAAASTTAAASADSKSISAESAASDSGSTVDTSNASVVLKLGHIQSESDLWHLGSEKFRDKLAELSNGDIRVDIYPNSTLGGDRDMAEGMQMGTVDIALIAGVLSNFDDSISILEIPYLFRSPEEFEKVIYGDIGDEIAQHVLDSSGIRILDWWERGPRKITSNKPINSVDDMKGLKIRIPEISAMQQVFDACGAASTTMAWSEVYTSLQQGVIEAQENPIPFFYSSSIYEVNKYIANTDHKYEYVTMAMSDQTWQKLTAEQQEWVKEAAEYATEYENSAVDEVSEKDLKDMVDNDGVQVTDPDTSGFISIADEVAPKYAESIGQKDLYDKIEAALGR
jgi:tripartite ATP-independent transporter DctP family solute receptor